MFGFQTRQGRNRKITEIVPKKRSFLNMAVELDSGQLVVSRAQALLWLWTHHVHPSAARMLIFREQ